MSPTAKLEVLAEYPFRYFAIEPAQIEQFTYLWSKSSKGLTPLALSHLDLILLDSLFTIIERRHHATN